MAKMRRPEVIRNPSGGFDFSEWRPGDSFVGKALSGALVLIILGWLVLGGPVYTIDPDEEGLLLQFGRYIGSSEPGVHFKLPWPIQRVIKVNTREVRKLEFGYRSYASDSGTDYSDFRDDQSLLDEARMLTGDENVVDASMAVQYQVRNATEWAFNFEDGGVESALHDIGEAALRQTVGDHPIDHVLTTRKEEMQGQIKETIQQLADKYGAGIVITEVQLQDVKPPQPVESAFQEVASSREAREKFINEALAYQSEQLPRAEGEAERMKQQALGYKEARIAEARGDVARFVAIMKEYDAAPEITRSRLYLETMSVLLPRVRLTVIDEDAGIVNLKSLNTPPLVEPAPPDTRQRWNRETDQ